MDQFNPDIQSNLSLLQQSVDDIRSGMEEVIVGQQNMMDLLLVGVLAGGHVLLEGVPGVAKTLTAKMLSKCLQVPFGRIQFTPDLMPGDVLGTAIFNPGAGSFQFRKGPVFTQILLIDEINRAPAKTQAALFEVMEEKQITADGTTYTLEEPFMVVATQNPIEQEGTYRLPEAQLDRFLLKIDVPLPSAEEEIQILQRHHQGLFTQQPRFSNPLSRELLLQLKEQVRGFRAEEKLIDYITKIVVATRQHHSIFLGASPRASIGILTASKAMAALQGRDFITPDDILRVAVPVLRHRIVLTPEKEMEGGTTDEVIQSILSSIEVPK